MGRLTRETDSEERRFGSGWISGMLSIVLGTVGLLTVLCLMYPQLLTVADIRAHYEVGLIRIILHLVLIVAFAFGVLSVVLRHNLLLGFAGIGLVLAATVLGGSQATRRFDGTSDIYFGLDFFLLNLILLGVIFIPIERVFRRLDQPIFRGEWREDLFYFFVSSLFVQSLTYLSLTPALNIVEATARATGVRNAIAGQPFLLQFVEIMFFTDLVQYWFHRSFHEIPWLWRFHSIHHSARYMDWIAGSRMHVLEIVLLRAFTTLPMYVLGFAESALYVYIFYVYLHSVVVHANVRFRFAWLQHVLVTPRFHHWHHGIEQEAINVNYAVHFPWLDRLFGTYYFPQDKWPDGYGIHGDVPRGYWKQLLHPFVKSKPSEPQPDDGTGQDDSSP